MNDEKEHFRGCFFPKEIWDMLTRKEITPIEMILLGRIDSLTRDESHGCFARKKTLASYLGVSPRWIQAKINKLRKQGLIRTEVKDEIRHMWVTYNSVDRGERPFSPPENDPSPIRSSLLRKDSDKRPASAKAEGGAPEGSGINGFFETPNKPSKVKVFDYQNADILHSAIVSKYNIRRRWIKSSWAKELGLLYKDLGSDALRLTKVLAYFGSFHQGAPTIINAKQFRKHFHWLEDRMNKGPSAIAKKDVKMDEAAEFVYKTVSKWHWPKGSKDSLPWFIQTCVENLRIFHNLRHNPGTLTLASKNKDPYLPSFIQMMSTKFIETETFIEEWCRWVYEQVKDWKDWSGNLKTFLFDMKAKFSLGAKRFDQIGKEWSTDWSGDTTYWILYKELLNEDYKV